MMIVVNGLGDKKAYHILHVTEIWGFYPKNTKNCENTSKECNVFRYTSHNDPIIQIW